MVRRFGRWFRLLRRAVALLLAAALVAEALAGRVHRRPPSPRPAADRLDTNSRMTTGPREGLRRTDAPRLDEPPVEPDETDRRPSGAIRGGAPSTAAVDADRVIRAEDAGGSRPSWATISLVLAGGLVGGMLLFATSRPHPGFRASATLRLPTSDASCLYMPCHSSGVIPSPEATIYARDQVNWMRSFAFANRVSSAMTNFHPSPDFIQRSVTVSEQGDSRRAIVTVVERDPETARELAIAFCAVYVSSSEASDARALRSRTTISAWGGERALRAAARVRSRAKHGSQPSAQGVLVPDRLTGASLVRSVRPARALSGGETLRRRIQRATVASTAGALVVFGALGLLDASRRGARRRRTAIKPVFGAHQI